MEVHHHTHTPRKKFRHYFWEFFMLFLAVIAGFLVENQREHYIEHKRAKTYAVMLKLDLRNDTAQLAELLKADSNKIATKEFFNVMSSKKIDSITIGDLRRRQKMSYSLNHFIPNNATYEQMKTSGTLRYFGDPEIILKLAQYEWTLKRFYEIKEAYINFYGGFSSEHFLQHDITIDQFMNDKSDYDSNLFAKRLGYTFKSWHEKNAIVSNLLSLDDIVTQFIYPQLKLITSELLKLIDDKYHLE